MRALLWPLVALLLLLPAGCGAKPKELIVGKWQDDGGITVEYKPDGTLEIIAGGTPIMGSYKFLKDDIIEMEVEPRPGIKDKKQWKITIIKNELTTTGLGDATEVKKFKRV